MIDHLLLKLRRRHEVSAEEEAVLRRIAQPVRQVPARTVLIREGQRIDYSTLLIDGMMGRYKDMRDGRRQISALHISGDFLDLHSFMLKRLDHDVMALSDCTVSIVSHDEIEWITEQHPRLGRLFWFQTNLDAATHRAWEVSLGRRSALARTAHLFCELYVRMKIVGLTDERGYRLPLTQIDLAECLGLTSVHVNRVLKELRESGLATFRNGRVDIDNFEKLQRVAEFDADYLYVDPGPA
ncbi:Crp/Fnr family transcriptional regulator [Sphingomonas montanisoli]|uniref:Crp/Fnr family transcriptional regulator n=1 Tax=Sphingomonas montanisoli TaxID=2606412 RepID=A0A5D9CAQ0_9SPHN|nr:Crp/Fnr family transcriptional regulator [Sphingomonas montanisoli]TZG27181.1 Crp/Fnr family transcriptional regulator [Sphingomonas montanisoli]